MKISLFGMLILASRRGLVTYCSLPPEGAADALWIISAPLRADRNLNYFDKLFLVNTAAIK